jgi:hypothetical protein
MCGWPPTCKSFFREEHHAEEQTKRTTGHLPPHGPGTPDPKENVRANPDLKKKTGD